MSELKVTVIVAVYNPGAHIGDLLDSLDRQSLSPDEFEVIFADDDSTDGTRERLQEHATRRRYVAVLHNTPNSGWPGKPRNMALDVARGKYVIFVDNDDWLPDRALEHLWDYAEEHDSDVVVAKEIGHGRVVPWSVFARDVPDAELGRDPLLRILTPHKLFRLAMLNEHSIRFPEGKVRLEDHLFVMQAYFASKVISIYAANPCYHWMQRDDRSNATRLPVDPDVYYRDLDVVLDVVEAHTEPGELRDTMYAHWYRLKMLRPLSAGGFAGLSADDQRRRYDAVRRIVVARFGPGVDTPLAPADRVRSHLLRADEFDSLRRLAEAERGITTAVAMTDLDWRDGVLVVGATATLVHADGAPVLFESVGERVLRVLPEGVEVPEELRDVTSYLRRITTGLTLRNRETSELWNPPATHAHELRPAAGGRLELTGTVSARIDPEVAFHGAGLPRISDALLRFAALGWGAERRFPFDRAVAARAGSLAEPRGDEVITAYPTQETDKLSLRVTRRPAAGTATAARSSDAARSRPKPKDPIGRVLRRIHTRLRRARRAAGGS